MLTTANPIQYHSTVAKRLLQVTIDGFPLNSVDVTGSLDTVIGDEELDQPHGACALDLANGNGLLHQTIQVSVARTSGLNEDLDQSHGACALVVPRRSDFVSEFGRRARISLRISLILIAADLAIAIRYLRGYAKSS